jgi:hypothetical protein
MVVASLYLCGEHGVVDAISLEPDAAPIIVAEPHHTHGADPESVSSQIPQRPVPAIFSGTDFHPMQHDPWPWWDDETGASWHQTVLNINRHRSNFLIATNGAHRQAMNEFEAMTA